MNSNENPILFGQGRMSDDPLTEIARGGGRRLRRRSFRRASCRRTPQSGSPWHRSGADPVHLRDPSPVGAALAQPERAAPGSVSALGGISTGDFQEALEAILGPESPNLSHGVISRLTGEWDKEHDAWQRRDLSTRDYAYVWADGVHLQARMEPAVKS